MQRNGVFDRCPRRGDRQALSNRRLRDCNRIGARYINENISARGWNAIAPVVRAPVSVSAGPIVGMFVYRQGSCRRRRRVAGRIRHARCHRIGAVVERRGISRTHRHRPAPASSSGRVDLDRGATAVDDLHCDGLPVRAGLTTANQKPRLGLCEIDDVVTGDRRDGDRRCKSIEGEAEGRGCGRVAGHIGLANLNGVETLDRGERIAPGRTVVDRILDNGAGLDAGESQRAVVGDMVGIGATTVDGQRHAGRRRCNRIEGEAQAGGAGHVAGDIGLANLNGVDALDRGERIAPGRAVVD